MKDYQIISDSSCDTPTQLLTAYNIKLVPFYITFDLENYHKENIEITNTEFYQKLETGTIFPKTSLPSVQDYINIFTEAITEGKDVLCICITHKFSGSYQSAMNAKLIVEEKYTDAKIVVIDSIQATAGEGMVLLQAAYMREAGISLDKAAIKIESIKQTARIMFTLDTLTYLQKGGRIGKVTSLAGAMLNLKPLIQLKDAELIPYSNVRGRKKSLEKVLFMVEEYFKETNSKYDDYDFCIANATTKEEVEALKPALESLIGKQITYPMFQIGVTIGTYTGPGAIGVCFIKKFDA